VPAGHAGERGEIVIGRTTEGDTRRAGIAARYGVYLVIGVFETLNQTNDAGRKCPR
jgi:hypothetical protein